MPARHWTRRRDSPVAPLLIEQPLGGAWSRERLHGRIQLTPVGRAYACLAGAGVSHQTRVSGGSGYAGGLTQLSHDFAPIRDQNLFAAANHLNMLTQAILQLPNTRTVIMTPSIVKTPTSGHEGPPSFPRCGKQGSNVSPLQQPDDFGGMPPCTGSDCKVSTSSQRDYLLSEHREGFPSEAAVRFDQGNEEGRSKSGPLMIPGLTCMLPSRRGMPDRSPLERETPWTPTSLQNSGL